MRGILGGMEMPPDKEKWRAAYRSRVEAVERVRARELVGMSEERAREIMASLVACEVPWRQRKDWSGLVEQQALFALWRKR